MEKIPCQELNFRKKFDIVREDSDDGILRQLFKWNTTRDKLRNEYPPNSLAKEGKGKDAGRRGFPYFIWYIKGDTL